MTVEMTVREEIDPASPAFKDFLQSDGKRAEQFTTELLPLLRHWLDANRAAIARTLIRIEGKQLYVMLGTRSQSFDFELSERVSQFLLDVCLEHGWSAMQILAWPGDPSFEDLRTASGYAASEVHEGG